MGALRMCAFLLVVTAAGCADDLATVPDAAPADDAAVVYDAETVDASIADASTADATIDAEVDAAPSQDSIQGQVEGLIGGTVGVSLNGVSSLTLTANGPFSFPEQLSPGENYFVAVDTQPGSPEQFCSVHHGHGIMGSEPVTNVRVSCDADINLVISAFGVEGAGLTLRNIDGQQLSIPGDGRFAFAMPIAKDAAFQVEVLTQPSDPAQSCAVYGGVGSADYPHDIDNIVVDCGSSESERILWKGFQGERSIVLARVFPGGIMPSPEPPIVRHGVFEQNLVAFFARAGGTIFTGMHEEGLLETEVGTGTLQTASLPDLGDVPREPLLSSDGRLLFNMSNVPGPIRQLYARDLDDTPLQKTIVGPATELLLMRYGTATHGAAWTLQQADTAFDLRLFLHARDGSAFAQERRLSPEGARASPPVFAKAGNRFVFVVDHALATGSPVAVHVATFDGQEVSSEHVIYGPLPGGLVRDLSISDSGDWAAFGLDDVAYVADLRSAMPAAIPISQDAGAFPKFKFRPGANELVVGMNDELFYLDLDQSASTLHPIDDGRGVAWSEGGELFLYQKSDSQGLVPFVARDVGGASLQSFELPRPEVEGVADLFVVSDSEVYGAARSEGTSSDRLVRWTIAAQDSSFEILTPALPGDSRLVFGSYFEAAGAGFYRVSGSNGTELWRLDLQTGEARIVPWFSDPPLRFVEKVLLP